MVQDPNTIIDELNSENTPPTPSPNRQLLSDALSAYNPEQLAAFRSDFAVDRQLEQEFDPSDASLDDIESFIKTASDDEREQFLINLDTLSESYPQLEQRLSELDIEIGIEVGDTGGFFASAWGGVTDVAGNVFGTAIDILQWPSDKIEQVIGLAYWDEMPMGNKWEAGRLTYDSMWNNMFGDGTAQDRIVADTIALQAADPSRDFSDIITELEETYTNAWADGIGKMLLDPLWLIGGVGFFAKALPIGVRATRAGVFIERGLDFSRIPGLNRIAGVRKMGQRVSVSNEAAIMREFQHTSAADASAYAKVRSGVVGRLLQQRPRGIADKDVGFIQDIVIAMGDSRMWVDNLGASGSRAKLAFDDIVAGRPSEFFGAAMTSQGFRRLKDMGKDIPDFHTLITGGTVKPKEGSAFALQAFNHIDEVTDFGKRARAMITSLPDGADIMKMFDEGRVASLTAKQLDDYSRVRSLLLMAEVQETVQPFILKFHQAADPHDFIRWADNFSSGVKRWLSLVTLNNPRFVALNYASNAFHIMAKTGNPRVAMEYMRRPMGGVSARILKQMDSAGLSEELLKISSFDGSIGPFLGVDTGPGVQAARPFWKKPFTFFIDGAQKLDQGTRQTGYAQGVIGVTPSVWHSGPGGLIDDIPDTLKGLDDLPGFLDSLGLKQVDEVDAFFRNVKSREDLITAEGLIDDWMSRGEWARHTSQQGMDAAQSGVANQKLLSNQLVPETLRGDIQGLIDEGISARRAGNADWLGNFRTKVDQMQDTIEMRSFDELLANGEQLPSIPTSKMLDSVAPWQLRAQYKLHYKRQTNLLNQLVMREYITTGSSARAKAHSNLISRKYAELTKWTDEAFDEIRLIQHGDDAAQPALKEAVNAILGVTEQTHDDIIKSLPHSKRLRDATQAALDVELERTKSWLGQLTVTGTGDSALSVAPLGDAAPIRSATISRKGRDGRNIVATFDRNAHQVTIDPDSLKVSFDTQSWTKPRKLPDGSRAAALPADTFPDVGSYRRFVGQHEQLHATMRRTSETAGAFETRINKRALALIQGEAGASASGLDDITSAGARLSDTFRSNVRKVLVDQNKFDTAQAAANNVPGMVSGNIGQMVPTSGRAFVEGAKTSLEFLDSMKGSFPARMAKSQALTNSELADLRKFIPRIKASLRDLKVVQNIAGRHTRDLLALNYGQQYGIDAVLSLALPYHFWIGRTMHHWMKMTMAQPGFTAAYTKLYDAVGEINESADVPGRIKNSIRIPIPGLDNVIPGGGDGSLYFDPLKMLFPFASFQNDTDFNRGVETTALGRVWDGAQQMTMGNPLITGVAGATGLLGDRDTYLRRAINIPSIPGGLPGPRAARAIMEWMTGSVSEPDRSVLSDDDIARLTAGEPLSEGSLKSAFKAIVDFSTTDGFDNYRIDRTIASLVGADPQRWSAEEALRAMKDRSGPLFELAQRESRTDHGAAALTGWLITPMRLYPEGEAVQRGLDAMFRAARNGGNDSMNEFFENHPEYRIRQITKENREDGSYEQELDTSLFFIDIAKVDETYDDEIEQLRGFKKQAEELGFLTTKEGRRQISIIDNDLDILYASKEQEINDLEALYPDRLTELGLRASPRERALFAARNEYFDIRRSDFDTFDQFSAARDKLIERFLDEDADTADAMQGAIDSVVIWQRYSDLMSENPDRRDQLISDRDTRLRALTNDANGYLTRDEFLAYVGTNTRAPTQQRVEYTEAKTQLTNYFAIDESSGLSERQRSAYKREFWNEHPLLTKYFGNSEPRAWSAESAAIYGRMDQLWDGWFDRQQDEQAAKLYLANILEELNSLRIQVGLFPLRLIDPMTEPDYNQKPTDPHEAALLNAEE